MEFRELVTDKWDAEFVNNMSKQTMCDILLAANYMDITSLLNIILIKIITLYPLKSLKSIKESIDDANIINIISHYNNRYYFINYIHPFQINWNVSHEEIEYAKRT